MHILYLFSVEVYHLYFSCIFIQEQIQTLLNGFIIKFKTINEQNPQTLNYYYLEEQRSIGI